MGAVCWDVVVFTLQGVLPGTHLPVNVINSPAAISYSQLKGTPVNRLLVMRCRGKGSFIVLPIGLRFHPFRKLLLLDYDLHKSFSVSFFQFR